MCHVSTRTPYQLVAAAMAGLLCASGAWASLGGDLASVGSDAQAFGATSNQTAVAGAALHTQTLPSGVTLRQYVNAAGRVFAVGWEGPVQPDFERLLGPYYQAYAAALRQQRRGVSVQAADLVIESGGMMRSFVGRAYLPPSLPGALAAQDIR